MKTSSTERRPSLIYIVENAVPSSAIAKKIGACRTIVAEAQEEFVP